MTEDLTCERCGETFTRTVSRGRKPKVGPCCIDKPIAAADDLASARMRELAAERIDRLMERMEPLHRLQAERDRQKEK